jgi:hypothetical protein
MVLGTPGFENTVDMAQVVSRHIFITLIGTVYVTKTTFFKSPKLRKSQTVVPDYFLVREVI